MKKLFLAFALLSLPAAADDWQTLGPSDFRAYRGDSLPAGWQAEGDALSVVAKGAGDIVSKESYSDFELVFEWKISVGGNSGVFFHVKEADDLPYAFYSGPEYQVLDNKGRSEPPLEQAGSLFALYAPEADHTKPVGEFNEGRILVKDGKVEHWLNGHLVVAYDMGSDEFRARVAGAKFAKWPAFAASGEGHIALQDHGDPVTFRHIRIRRLPAE